MSAMQDAVISINCICDLGKPTFENIKAILAGYRSQWFDHAAFQVNMSSSTGKVMFDRYVPFADFFSIAAFCDCILLT